MSDKLLSLLIGISQNIEKSLDRIEKSLSTEEDSKSSSSLNGVAGGLSSLVSVATTKKFTKSKADTLLNFTKGIITTINSVDEKKSKEFAKFSKGFSSAITSMVKSFTIANMTRLVLAEKVLFGKLGIFKRIVHGMSDAVKTAKLDKIKEFGDAIGPLGEGLKTFSRAMISLSLVAAVAPLALIGGLVIRGVVGLFVSLGKHAQEIKGGGEAIRELGKGLLFFSAGLASIVLAVAIIKPKLAIEAIGIIALFATTFALVGMLPKKITEGANAIRNVGIAIALFSGGLALLSLVMLIVKPQNIIIGLGLVIAFSLAFYFIGKISKGIAEGALVISVAMLVTSLALIVFAYVGKIMSWEELAKGAAAILAIGGAFALIGVLEKSKLISKGTAAMKKVGIVLLSISAGILLFGLSLKALQAIFPGRELGEAGMLGGAILVGLAGAFALMGVPPIPGFIDAGAVAMTTVGISLLAISGGILVFGLAIKGLQAIFGKDLAIAGKIGGGILLGLALAFSAIGLLSVLILIGAATGIVMGASIILISVGILALGGAIKVLDKLGLITKEGGMKGIKVIGDVAREIAHLARYFLTVPLGAAVGLYLGLSLLAIGGGLSKAAKALEEIPNAEAFTSKLFDESKGIIPSLARGFASIADIAGGGFLGSLSTFLGTDPVSRGIRSVKGMGKVLSELAGGIVKFSNFEEFPVQIPDSKDPSKLIYSTVDIFGDVIPSINENIPKLLTSLSEVFGKIGEKYGGSLLKKGLVRKGADAVKDMGEALMEIAGGVVKFADFARFPVQIPDPSDPSRLIYSTVDIFGEVIPSIYQNLPTLLTSLAPVFEKIANDYPGGFLKKSKVSKGIEIAKDLGSAVSDIVGGILAFADLQRFPLEWDKEGKPVRFGPVDISAIGDSIRQAVMILPNVFEQIDIATFEKAQEKAEAVLPLTKTTKKIVEYLGSMMKILEGKETKDGFFTSIGMSIRELVDNLASISIEQETLNRLNNLADIFKKFSSMGEGFSGFVSSFKEFTPVFGTYVSTMGNFSGNFMKFSSQMKNFEKFTSLLNSMAIQQENYKKFVPSFKSISADLKIFSENFRTMDSVTIESFKIWTEALTDFIKVDSSSFRRNAENTKNLNDIVTKENSQSTSTTTPAGSSTNSSATNTTNTSSTPAASKQQKSSLNEENITKIAEGIASLNIQMQTISSTLNRLGGIDIDGGAIKVSISE